MSNLYHHDVFISFSFKDQALAENIVNVLSSAYGISCWICTRDVEGGETYKSLITEAIDCAKIVVFLQSAFSVESKEVPKEIGMALEEGKTIIPFRLDDAKLKGALRYDLHGVEYIDATVPTFPERVADLAKAIKNALGEGAAKPAAAVPAGQRLLCSPNVNPKPIFCGRQEILSEIRAHYQSGENVLFLCGIGGIGKTQIAQQYVKRYRGDYDTVVYATYSGSVKDVVLSDAAFVMEPEMIRYTLSDGTMETDDDFFARKLKRIKKLSVGKTLIVLDNFDVESDGNLSDLLEINACFLITSRCDYSRQYPTRRIDPIDSMEALKDIFMRYYDGHEVERGDPDLDELIELVNRHTYTVELLAQHMGNTTQTARDMIEALKREGILSLNEEVEGEETQIAYENLLKMFRLFSLNAEEKQILTYLSLMPLGGVSARDFKEWSGLTSLKLVNRLEKRSWILRNPEGIALHPIIQSVIRHELPATEENCIGFINRFTESIGGTKSWHLKKTDKDKYGAVAKALLSAFHTITPGTEDMYYESECLLSFAVDPEYAEDLARRLYFYYKKEYDYESFKVGRAAFKLGWLYAYNTYFPNAIEKALKWLEEADRILSAIRLNGSDQMAQLALTKVNLAKMHMMRFEQTREPNAYLLAKMYAEDDVKYCLSSFSPGDLHFAKIAGAYIQLAEVLLAGGEYEAALDNAEKGVDILVSLHTEDNGDSMLAINRKAAVLHAMGKYKEAKPLVQKGVKGYEKYFGENNLIVIGLYTLLGDCCTALGEPDEALPAYRKALEIAKRLYAPGAKQITEIRERIEKI